MGVKIENCCSIYVQIKSQTNNSNWFLIKALSSDLLHINKPSIFLNSSGGIDNLKIDEENVTQFITCLINNRQRTHEDKYLPSLPLMLGNHSLFFCSHKYMRGSWHLTNLKKWTKGDRTYKP